MCGSLQLSEDSRRRIVRQGLFEDYPGRMTYIPRKILCVAAYLTSTVFIHCTPRIVRRARAFYAALYAEKTVGIDLLFNEC